MTRLLIKETQILTMNEQMDIFSGDVLIEDDRITQVGQELDKVEEAGTKVIHAKGKTLLPGFVQTHVHLCQSIFRGQADDMELMDWLQQKIWPLEASHDETSLYDSAMLGLGELIQGGTTTVVDMETVNHTDAAFEALAQSGMRALSGKVMMDVGNELPPALLEDTQTSIAESTRLLEKWHGYDGGRLQYAYAPRFVVSCTEELLTEVRDLAKYYDVYIHTHASENLGEIQIVEEERGMRNVEYLDHLGLAHEKLILAHCIWLSDREKQIIRDRKVKMSHCPGSNLKLASGVADVCGMSHQGTHISLGADGAPCNNALNMFQEMKLAALLPKPTHGPAAMPAEEVLKMATIEGARAIGMEEEIGSIEEGKKADLALLDLNKLHTSPRAGVDPISSIVYSATAQDVETTIINGEIIMENRELKTMNETEVLANADRSMKRLLSTMASMTY
ncbi:5'-deoxyadenosine deaminase [Salsuginibacillus kocurii]|uniref:5'-deoxyadenosine deaminase n=1 Tax=Salsuginibacillus kocurii TaxID=427078 RepID=UPI0003733B7B|nr:5'-deoxyadenosine deaminase [Salsuginibacillus kocurii]